MKVNAFTTGYNAPSARYRVRQNVPFLKKLGVHVNEIYSKSGSFPPPDRLKQLLWAASNLTENSIKMLSQPSADVTWLQKVLMSKHYTFEGFLKRPLVFDVDDAIFIPQEDFVKKIALQSQKIICGNSFLANNFSRWNTNIDIIPTAVDVSRYDNIVPTKSKDFFYILWTGTQSGFPFVYQIEKALKIIVDRYDYVKIKIVSDLPPTFKILEPNDYIFNYWNREIEFSSIVNADIGIMPLKATDRSRGKCSYKMLCYMAAKLPVVVSPIGMNKEVLDLGKIGFGPTNIDEWVDALEQLVINSKLHDECSKNAFDVVNSGFDIKTVSKQIKKTFTSL